MSILAEIKFLKRQKYINVTETLLYNYTGAIPKST